MENELFIIGNGFDLHLGLQTKYSDFANFLKATDPDAFDACNDFLGYSSEAKSIWGNFEESLGLFSQDGLIEKCRDSFNDADPQRSGEASWEARKYVDLIATNIPQAFQSFIASLQYPSDINGKNLRIPKNALYLNFNYTDTLQRFFGISLAQICHIHGTKDNIQIGHGVHPSDVASSNPPPVKPPNMTPDQEEYWTEQMNDEYSSSFNRACIEIDKYWARSFKDVASNIRANQDFFDRCNGITSITIKGHSLSTVDIPYFEEIKRRVSANALWHVSFHSNGEDQKHKETLISLGVDETRITTFPLKDRLARN
ncbi:MAG: bacteriophage abortive infection AbiH family protein [Alphaproteobacteria bacterium]|nr:bacteriophage abortive infection AbiH family protein [Alphaproteobacteria bacterium]